MRSSAEAWVAAQMAKRATYIARLAAQLGIDPAEAARAWGSRSLGGASFAEVLESCRVLS